VADRMRELGLPVTMLNVSERPSVDGKYHRLRDELFWKARMWFEGRDVHIDDDALTAELADILYGYTSNGLIKLESKDETKDRLGRSPDLADAFVATFAVSPVSIAREADRYERARRRMQMTGNASWAA